MSSGVPKAIDISAFDPNTHIRTDFRCGVSQIDNFIHRTAKKHQKGDFTRVWVACEVGAPRVIGYYSMNTHAFDPKDWPESVAKHAPRNRGIPALYLSMIGVDESYQGRGVGTLLMSDAMQRAAKASVDVGIKFLVLDALGTDEDAGKHQAFYLRLGFMALASRPSRMFITTGTLRAAMK